MTVFAFMELLILTLLPALVFMLDGNAQKTFTKAADIVGLNESNTTTDVTQNLTKDSERPFNETALKRVSNDINNIIEKEWNDFCTASFRYISGSNFTAEWAILLACSLRLTDHWALHTYRKWVSENENFLIDIVPPGIDLRIAVKLKCSRTDRSSISLPWPVKAKYLWYISVDNCKIIDHLKEYNKAEPHKEYLSVMEVTNSVMETDVNQFLDTIVNYADRSIQYDCGAINTEKYVFRNVSKTFSEPVETTTQALNKTQIFDAWAKVGQENQQVQYICIFSRLRYIDESNSRSVSTHHLHFLTEHVRLPALEYFNFSNSHVEDIRIQFLEWRRYFPKMKYLDLSHNRIKYFAGISDFGLSTDPIGVINLRHNNITTLSKDDIKTLKFQSETVFIDIRDNPISCDCKLSDLMNTIKNSSSILLDKYSYILDLRCAKPDALSGRKLSDLDKEFCEFIEVFSLVVPVVILSCCLALLAAVLFITIKYRKEIMILAFTRLNISLPCRETVDMDKQFDAFICYSEQDMDWVIYTFLPWLEDPNNGPGFKLCIHHRDFPVGGTIFDNIDNKVKESRHTVLVLSNHFLRSTWCRCEFWAAFTESLTQKKRHLIMIIKEDLDDKLIEPALKRCLKTFTYVRLDDRLFWDKIIYSLSDRKKENGNDKNRKRGQEADLGVPDALEGAEVRERGNAVELRQVLDGINNNRNERVVFRANQVREHMINKNARQMGDHGNLQNFDRNVDRNDMIYKEGGENQNINHGVIHPVQDGEWVL